MVVFLKKDKKEKLQIRKLPGSSREKVRVNRQNKVCLTFIFKITIFVEVHIREPGFYSRSSVWNFPAFKGLFLIALHKSVHLMNDEVRPV